MVAPAAGEPAAGEPTLLLTIRHRTTYRYRQPVAFGEHRMMLRPRDCAAQRVIDIQLAIDPAPARLHSIQDGYGNHIGIAAFSGRANTLSFESTVRVEHDPESLSQAVHVTEDPAALAPYLARDPAALDAEVSAFAQSFRAENEDAWPLLCALSDGIHRGFAYRRREAQGIQTPLETLQLGHGACRDFALLMIAAARALGFAARFASGYLAPGNLDVAFDGSDAAAPDYTGGNTHAWAQVYLPRLGWVDFDPTSGSVGRQGLITVAVTAAPEEATPLSGTFLGFPADHIGMEVAVTISAGTPPGTA
jgi:transglutaminase-like putative cysteine protease